MKKLVSALALTTLVTACGAPTPGPDSGINRPDGGVADSGVAPQDSSAPGEINVVGAWVGSAAFDRAVDMRQSIRLSFNGSAESGSYTMRVQWTFIETDTLANCNALARVNGSYAVAGDRVSLTANDGLVTTSGCTDASQNLTDMALTTMQLEPYNVSGTAMMPSMNAMRIGRLDLTRE